jgi:hypothetical protein
LVNNEIYLLDMFPVWANAGRTRKDDLGVRPVDNYFPVGMWKNLQRRLSFGNFAPRYR